MKEWKMPLNMTHIVRWKPGRQWKYLTDKTGFLFSGTHSRICFNCGILVQICTSKHAGKPRFGKPQGVPVLFSFVSFLSSPSSSLFLFSNASFHLLYYSLHSLVLFHSTFLEFCLSFFFLFLFIQNCKFINIIMIMINNSNLIIVIIMILINDDNNNDDNNI